MKPTSELRSWIRILGLNVKSTHAIARDGYAGVRAAPYYSQQEMEKMVTEAQESFNARHSKHWFTRIRDGRSYAQDLTARLFALPGSLVNRLGALLDTRHSATNKSQYVRREWKVVFMDPMENPIGGEVTQDHCRPGKSDAGFMRQRHSSYRDCAPMQKWLLVIRGQVTLTSEDGFAAFDTFSNPWLKTDQRLHIDRGVRVKSARH